MADKNDRKKLIVFTGGGSGGHVVPGLTLISVLRNKPGVTIHYIGGHQGIEKELALKNHLPYFSIATGKLRRYLSMENLKDFFRIWKGLIDAWTLLSDWKKKYDVLVFSTGGFVSVPVVVVARLLGLRVFIHEQTARAGLANRICGFFAHQVFISFEDSVKYFDKQKTAYSGYPLRPDCFHAGFKPYLVNGYDLLAQDRPLLFITGGGNGSLLLNNLVKNNLAKLTERYRIIHQVGKNFLQEYKKLAGPNYYPFDFINEGMVDILKRADIVVSRAGAGTVAELMAVGRPSIFIPLAIAQKNEQYYNALEAKEKVGSLVVTENELKTIDFVKLIDDFSNHWPDQGLKQVRPVKPVIPNGLDFLVNKIEINFLTHS